MVVVVAASAPSVLLATSECWLGPRADDVVDAVRDMMTPRLQEAYPSVTSRELNVLPAWQFTRDPLTLTGLYNAIPSRRDDPKLMFSRYRRLPDEVEIAPARAGSENKRMRHCTISKRLHQCTICPLCDDAHQKPENDDSANKRFDCTRFELTDDAIVGKSKTTLNQNSRRA